MKKKSKGILGGAGFYTTLLLCLVAVGVASWMGLFRGHSSAPAESAPVQREEVSSGDSGIPAKATAAPVTTVPEENEKSENTVQMPEETVDSTPVVAEKPTLTVAPVKGGVVEAFAMEQLIYDPTLGDWRTHDGVDIAADLGTDVLAAANGTVDRVTDDPMMGTTVVLKHADGSQTVYANLESKPPVKAGDTVTAGEVIGAVGATSAAESGEASHLHFGVLKDGKPVNPESYLK
jgi:murein DD-endopeptidase MepM/ murein hydrolase activator NlpD